MIALIALSVVIVLLVGALVVVWRRGRMPRLPERTTGGRILVPFTGGALDRRVLQAAIRIARAESATLVPAYVIVLPWDQAEDSPMQQQVTVAMPLLEAVEHAALRAGVPVDARIESGRSPIHALQRLWEAERFDRIVVPAPAGRGPGFSPKDLSWMLSHSPSETLILRPNPLSAVATRPADAAPRRGGIRRREDAADTAPRPHCAPVPGPWLPQPPLPLWAV